MQSPRKFLVKPGTLFMLVLMTALGIAIFNWAANYTEHIGDESAEERKQAVDCSTLEVNFVGEDSNDTHRTFYAQINKKAEAIALTVKGENNITKIIDDPSAGSVHSITVPFNQVESVEAKVMSCSKVFTR